MYIYICIYIERERERDRDRERDRERQRERASERETEGRGARTCKMRAMPKSAILATACPSVPVVRRILAGFRSLRVLFRV